MKKFPAKAICRAGAIAALYAVLTIYLGNIAYGPLQIRPAEALTLLPLLYLESVPALFVGCLIALIAACLTYVMPRFFKKPVFRALVGGLFPVFLNALALPVMWLIMGGAGAFWTNLLSMSCTQLLWVYALGMPLYLALERLSYAKRSPLYPTNRFVLKGREKDKERAALENQTQKPQQ